MRLRCRMRLVLPLGSLIVIGRDLNRRRIQTKQVPRQKLL